MGSEQCGLSTPILKFLVFIYILFFCFSTFRFRFRFSYSRSPLCGSVRLLCMLAFRRVCNNNLSAATQRIIVGYTIIIRVGVCPCQSNCIWILRENHCVANNDALLCTTETYGVLRLPLLSQTIGDVFDLNRLCRAISWIFRIRAC